MHIKEFERQLQSGLVLANAVELGTAVIKDMAGNDIATSISGSKVTADTIKTMMLQRISAKLGKRAADAALGVTNAV